MRHLLLLTALVGGVALAADPPSASTYKPDKHAAEAYAKADAAGATQAKNPELNDPAAIAAGKQLFQSKCVTCHGTDGKGDGPAAMALDPHPANFTDHARWATTSIGVHHWIVMNGIRGSTMAPLGLTDDEAWQVLAYIQHTFEPTTVPSNPTVAKGGATSSGPVTSAP